MGWRISLSRGQELIFRQVRVIATGQWVDVLFTAQGKPGQPDAFSISPESHQAAIARAINLLPTALEVLDADSDLRTGVMLSVPPDTRLPLTRRQILLEKLQTNIPLTPTEITEALVFALI